jgi:probable rRNA maturation factor
MILLDPDLESATLRQAGAAERLGGSQISGTDLRMPSERTLARFLARAQAAVRLRGEVSVLLTTDAAMRKLNRRFRGKDKATDVLSFPTSDPSQVSKTRPGAPISRVAGDLAISVETARRQCVEHGHALAMEMKILILHGLLHLNGFDHENDAGEMARWERALRTRLGLAEGLIERAAIPAPATGKSRGDGARRSKGASGARGAR